MLSTIDVVVLFIATIHFFQETWDKSYPEPDLRLIIIENTKQEEGWQGKLG